MDKILVEIKRLYYLIRHELGFSRGTLSLYIFKTIIIVIPVLVTLITWKYGLLLVLSYLIALFISRKEEYSPKHMQLSKDGYIGRKGLLTSALFELGDAVNLEKIDNDRLRAHALDMIVSYVRGFRSDIYKTKIFACLLSYDEQNEKIKVMLRDTDSSKKRPHSVEYDAGGMLAQKCFKLRSIQFTGNVKEYYPTTPCGKEYNSILCVPIFSKDGTRKILAAVSIDSTEMYHFDKCSNELYTYLMPYIALISITFWE